MIYNISSTDHLALEIKEQLPFCRLSSLYRSYEITLTIWTLLPNWTFIHRISSFFVVKIDKVLTKKDARFDNRKCYCRILTHFLNRGSSATLRVDLRVDIKLIPPLSMAFGWNHEGGSRRLMSTLRRVDPSIICG